MKTKLFFVLMIFPICIMAKASDFCSGSVISHPDMVFCIQDKTEKIEDSIKELIREDGSKYSLDMFFYNNQRKVILEKCSLYNYVDSQRFELLENECEFKEVSQLNDFLKNYMKGVDNY